MALATAVAEKRSEPKEKHKVAEIRIRMMKGGHMVSHHSEEYGQRMKEHVFSHEQGKEMMAHIAKHAKVHLPEPEREEEMEEKIAPGIHEKVAEEEGKE